MKFLLDENVDTEYVVSNSSFFTKSSSVVGRGVSDEQIFNYAKKNNLIVVTKDIRFALHMIVSGHKTVFVDKNYKSILVDPKVDVNRKYCSPITEYLERTESIVIP